MPNLYATPMEGLIHQLLAKSDGKPIQAQVTLKTGKTIAGALKGSDIAGVCQLLAPGALQGGQTILVALYFAAADVVHLDVVQETSSIVAPPGANLLPFLSK